jgi:hypothetical protein
MDSFSMLHNPYCSFVVGLNKMCFYVLLCFFSGVETRNVSRYPRVLFFLSPAL